MAEPGPKLISPGIVKLLEDERDPVRFIEIGANDGASFDPLAPYIAGGGWRGLMVEPVPHVFTKLARNHSADPNVELVNAAVGAADGTRTIHHLREGASAPGLPFWADAIASFDREHVIAALGEVADPESLLTSTEVECLSFATLCERHGVEGLDLLLIDAEGADWEILRSIDFDRRRPRVVVYEHHHLTETERAACESMLGLLGYTLVEEALDTWALDTVPDDSLTERWRRVLAAAAP